MTMTGKVAIFLAGSMLAFGAASNVSGASLIEGTWLTPTEQEMTISACVEGHCGYITKIVITDELRAKYGNDFEGLSKYTDLKNRNPSLRDRPIQGLQILTLRQGADIRHYEGEIYNPEDGNTYTGYIEVVNENVIKLRGCAMMVLCQEQLWQRVQGSGPAADSSYR